jgi:hypothetical protein
LHDTRLQLSLAVTSKAYDRLPVHPACSHWNFLVPKTVRANYRCSLAANSSCVSRLGCPSHPIEAMPFSLLFTGRMTTGRALSLPPGDNPPVYQVLRGTPPAIRQVHRGKTVDGMERIERVGSYLHIPTNVPDPGQHARFFVSLVSFHVMPPSRAHRYYPAFL